MTTVDGFDPIVEGALGILRDVAWNALAEWFEEPFQVVDENPEVLRRLDDALRYALLTGGQAMLPDDGNVGTPDLLGAFSAFVGTSEYEYAVVGLSAAGRSESVGSVFAKRGTPQSVAVPDMAIRQIRQRLLDGAGCNVVLVHNHPQGILHDLFGVTTLGPSATDRMVLSRTYRAWWETSGLLNCEFYLAEGGAFRKFILPSAEQVWTIATKVGLIR